MITLEIVKKHLRIDDITEDSYIEMLIKTATEDATAKTGIENDIDASERYKFACLMPIAYWHQDREGKRDLPPAYRALIAPMIPGNKYV